MPKEIEPKFFHTGEQLQLRQEISRNLGAYLATKSFGKDTIVQIGDQSLSFKEVSNTILHSFEAGRIFLYISPDRDDQVVEAKLRKQVVSKYVSEMMTNLGVPQSYIEGFSSLELQADMVCLCVGNNPNFDLEDKQLQKTLVQLFLLDARYPVGLYPSGFELRAREAEVVASNAFRVYRLTSFDPITYTNPNIGFYSAE